jgi:CubicO group peptidase (beta-lactamase class C family)
MNQLTSKHTQAHGSVAPGFESVKELFEHEMRTMAEQDSQLCVYHRGEKVVDLWASTKGDGSFSADSLVNVFSSGKSLEAIAIASLVSKGLLRYDARITQYWPEFGANGKEGLTVADLMRHEAGLANFDTSLDLEDLFTENIKQNVVGRIIEGHAPSFGTAGGSRREYHALTRGWIVNELFRRVDPAGRTIGEFLREEVSGPLDADVTVGVKEQELKRVSRVRLLGFGYYFLQSLLPRFLGRRIVHNIFQILGRLLPIIPAVIKSRKTGIPAPFTGVTGLEFFNDTNFAKGETPSANAKCSARGLAKVGAMMSAGGRYGGRAFLSEEAWQAAHEDPVKAAMGGILTTRFTQGGVDCFLPCTPDSSRAERDFNEGREGFYGWMGLGGSIFQWHPALDIGFAFVPTALHMLDLFNERGKRYQAEVLRCVERQTSTA